MATGRVGRTTATCTAGRGRGLLEAAPTRALVRPGDTIEFYTRFKLVLPPGRPDAHVEATWGSEMRWPKPRATGRRPTFAKAGIGLLSTALTLPVGTAPGRYTVYGRAPHRDRGRSGQCSLAVLGSFAVNLGVKPLSPFVRE